jgi:hypothetical protein
MYTCGTKNSWGVQRKDKENNCIWRSLEEAVKPNCDIIRIKSRRMGWAEHAARIAELRNAYKILVEKSEGETSLGRCTRVSQMKTVKLR